MRNLITMTKNNEHQVVLNGFEKVSTDLYMKVLSYHETVVLSGVQIPGDFVLHVRVNGERMVMNDVLVYLLDRYQLFDRDFFYVTATESYIPIN